MDAIGDVVGQVHDLAFHGFAGFGSSCLQPAEHVLVIRVHAELHAAATVVLGRFGEGPRVRRFLHVTVPGVRSTMVLIMLLSSAAAFRVFNEIYVLTGGTGGVGGKDVTMTMLIKNYGTGLNAKYGYAGAVSMLVFIIVGSLVAVEFFVQRKVDSDER